MCVNYVKRGERFLEGWRSDEDDRLWRGEVNKGQVAKS